MVNDWLKTGLGFGVTSGIITTLGLMVGLNSGTHSKMVVFGGVLTIATADALSDSMGIHISEESKGNVDQRHVWLSTLSTLFSKFIISLTFIIPLFLFPLNTAIAVSLFWGMSLLALFSYLIAREMGVHPGGVILEHLGIALVVVALTNYVGEWISTVFT
ncbi:MAG: hypothetical protein B6U97_01240 [Candidatus Altiarchaeales archaeon ex4484_96]|nr:MAG: hypothetical protein B6U97_01240 [Candidatus Altiarchaeales archaeon ex4484_96]